MVYTAPKNKFSKDSTIENIEIHFLNGDFLTIRKNEICNISLSFYDELLRHKDRLYAVARNGFIKLKIQPRKTKWEERELFDDKKYCEGRKEYIENRCVHIDVIKFVKLFDQDGNCEIIYGDIQASHEGDYLFLRFMPSDKMGTWEDPDHTVCLAPPSKNMIFKMRIDFENCEWIDVYKSEILEMNLNFNKRLAHSFSGYSRSVKSGYIKIKFDKNYDMRNFEIWNGRKKIKNLERRICGKKGCRVIDICGLYLEYMSNCELTGEIIDINNLYRTDYYDDVDPYSDDYDYCDENDWVEDDDYECYYENYFESGYAKKMDDGSILIVFGSK